jgi:hypothetical protein
MNLLNNWVDHIVMRVFSIVRILLLVLYLPLVGSDLNSGSDKSSIETHEDFLKTGSSNEVVICAVNVSNENPLVNEQLVVDIVFDLNGIEGRLGSFSAMLEWNSDVLEYIDSSELHAGFVGSINESKTDSGQILFNGANSAGEAGHFMMISFVFKTLGSAGMQSPLDLSFSAMARAGDFSDLLEFLTIQNGHITVSELSGPEAAFSAEPTSGFNPLIVHFTDESASGTGDIIFWSWDFGDGNFSTDQNPLHVYQAPGMYTVSLKITDDFGFSSTETKTDYIGVNAATGIDGESEIPSDFEMSQNFPNPFNPETTITYQLSSATRVSITISDISGNRITTLVNEYQSPGYYSVKWNVAADVHQVLPSGAYFIIMHTPVFSETKKKSY